MRGAFVIVGAALLLIVSLPMLRSLALPTSVKPCAAIENVGICDPYVPGVIIGKPRPDEPMRVVATWPDGPAEKAGICSGDQVVAINGVLAADNSISRLLGEILSATPTPVGLEVKRNSEIRDLVVSRVRESTLAELSKQKFALVGGVFSNVIYVPREELPIEIQQFRKFQDRIAASLGFKLVDDWYVPSATKRREYERVLAARQSNTMVGRVGFVSSPRSYSAGFLAILLPKTKAVLVDTVMPNSPAYGAGLLPGDRIQQIDGQDTSRSTAVKIRELLLRPDEERIIELKIDRSGSFATLHISTSQIKGMMNTALDPVPSEPNPTADDYVLGIQALYSENPSHAIVASVEYPSPAFDAGLHVGDLLLAINGSPIVNIDREQLAKLLSPDGPAKLAFEFSRLGKSMNATISPVTYRSALASLGRKPTKFGTAPNSCPND